MKTERKLRKIALSEGEERLPMSSFDETKGTEENPYSFFEFCDLLSAGEWKGGYVSCNNDITYVGADEFIATSYDNSGNPYEFGYNSDYVWPESIPTLDGYFASVFSFMNASALNDILKQKAEEASDSSNMNLDIKNDGVFYTDLHYWQFNGLSFTFKYIYYNMYVFVEVYVGSDYIIPEGYSVQFRLDDFEGNYMETQIFKISRQKAQATQKVGTFQYVKDKNYRMFIKVIHNNNIMETAQLP